MIHQLAKYYEVLELNASASQKEIKRAYFRLAKMYHPDVNSSIEARKKFLEINEAYEFLSDPQKVRNLLFRYTTQKQQQKRATKRAQKVKQNTAQKAAASKPEFERMVNKETLRHDFKRITNAVVTLVLFGTLLFVISFISNLNDPDSHVPFKNFFNGFLAFFICMIALYIFFLNAAYQDYLKFKNEHNKSNRKSKH